jgi:hypothetical protein
MVYQSAKTMSIVSESIVPQLILQLNAVQRQVNYRGMTRDLTDSYWNDHIAPKLYPLWDSDKDKLILFTYYDTGAFHVQRRKFIKNFATQDYEWKDYEMEVHDTKEALEIFEALKEGFYLIDSVEKENYQQELAKAYIEGKKVTWYGIRLARNFLLDDTDWVFGGDSPISDEEKVLWKTYRQALRDIPQNSSYTEAHDVKFPISPEDWKKYYKPEKESEGYLESEDQYLKLSAYFLSTFKERIIQSLIMRQQMMNPLNYKNYRDAMSSLPVYQAPQQNAEMVQQLRENQELDSTQVVDYLLTALDNTPTEETEETNND